MQENCGNGHLDTFFATNYPLRINVYLAKYEITILVNLTHWGLKRVLSHLTFFLDIFFFVGQRVLKIEVLRKVNNFFLHKKIKVES